ncbi:lipocalin-like domain-containing protein [Sneathiella glossodoripedis]|uniref:lipocalin-like domain-containing protein n=1 Tax=Sneathiella glossodoripedis TaxID=418853 RepID=UPI00046EB964|nr:lipocalin-like domain-containing protein [Sneathiella glossodoripedis]
MTQISDLIGTWELKDWRVYADGEFHKFPMGEDAKGLLIYTREGMMNGFLMRNDYSQNTPRTPARSEICLSYAGTYRLEGENVIHDVSLSTIPEWIGGPLVRSIEWKGDDLLLKTDPQIAANGKGYSNALLWGRVPMKY